MRVCDRCNESFRTTSKSSRICRGCSKYKFKSATLPKKRKIEKIKDIINKYNPIGIYVDTETNLDEYNPEIRLILSAFKKSKNPEGFLKKVYKIFVKMFGKKDARQFNDYTKMSDEIYGVLTKEQRFKLPELPENDELRDLIGDLYLRDGELAGAISTNKREIAKDCIKDMEEILDKIKKINTSNPEKQEAIEYIEESLDIARLYSS
jgi:hypothetical protein